MPPRQIIPNDPRRWGNDEDAEAIARSLDEAEPLTEEDVAFLEQVEKEAEEDDGAE